MNKLLIIINNKRLALFLIILLMLQNLNYVNIKAIQNNIYYSSDISSDIQEDNSDLVMDATKENFTYLVVVDYETGKLISEIEYTVNGKTSKSDNGIIGVDTISNATIIINKPQYEQKIIEIEEKNSSIEVISLISKKETLNKQSIVNNNEKKEKSCVKAFGIAEDEMDEMPIEIGNKIGFKIPKKLPLLGGSKLSFDLFKNKNFAFALGYDEQEGIIKYFVGTKENCLYDGKKKIDKKKCKQYKKDYNRRVYDFKNNANKHLKDFVSKKNLDLKESFTFAFKKIEFSAYAYGEYWVKKDKKDKSHDLGLQIQSMLEYKGKEKGKWFMIGCVPAYICFGFNAKASLSYNCTAKTKGLKINKFKNDLELTIPVTGNASMGVGLRNIVSCGVEGTCEIKPIFVLHDYVPMTAKVLGNLYANAFAELLGGKIESKKFGWNKDNTLWENDQSKKENAKKNNVVNNDAVDEYTILSRDYNYISNQKDEDQIIYPFSKVKTLTLDGQEYIFWLADINERSAADRTALMYAKLEDDGTFVQPQIIEDDGTADFNYEIVNNDGKIFVVWQDYASSINSDTDPACNHVIDSDISTAIIDPKTDSIDITTINGEYEGNLVPSIASDSENGQVLVTWYSTNTNNIYNGDQSERICYSIYENNRWSDVNVQSYNDDFISLSAGIIDNNLGILYEETNELMNMDSDEDVDIYHKLIFKPINGEEQIINEKHNDIEEQNEETDLTGEDNDTELDSDLEYFLLKCDNGTSVLANTDGEFINYIDELEVEHSVRVDYTFNEKTSVLHNLGNNKQVLFWVTKNSDNKTEIYGAFCNENSEWGEPVLLETSEGDILDLTAVDSEEGVPKLVYSEIENMFNEEQTLFSQLKLKEIEETVSAELLDANIHYYTTDDSNHAPLSTMIKNKGTTTIDTIIVTVDGPSGNYTKVYDELKLLPGNVITLEDEEFGFDEKFYCNSDYIVSIIIPGDISDANHSKTINAGAPDLELSMMEVTESASDSNLLYISSLTQFETNAKLNISVVKDKEEKLIEQYSLGNFTKDSIKAVYVNKEEILSEYNCDEVKCEVVVESDCDLDDNILWLSSNENKQDDGDMEEVGYAIEGNCIGGGYIDGIEPILYKTGDTINIVAVPDSGYEFIGWVTDNGTIIDETISNTTYVVADNNATITAIFIESDSEIINVNFNPNEGVINTDTVSYIVGEPYGTLPNPERTGYEFTGWYTEQVNGELVEATDTVTPECKVLYAHWEKKKENSILVTFNTQGGKLENCNKEIEAGEYYGTLPTPLKQGYVFLGWYTNDIGGTKINENDIVPNEDITLYAQWSATRITVNLLGEGKKTVGYNMPYGSLPEPKKYNYNFQGWFTTYTGGVQITEDSICTSEQNQVLYPHWKGIDSNLKFDASGGNVDIESKVVYYGETYGDLPIPSRKGYEFVGWYTQKNGGLYVDEDDIVDYTSDFVIYAKWRATEIVIEFNPNGGNLALSNKYVTYENYFGELPTPTRAGFTFTGWYTGEEDGDKITENSVVNNTKKIILYAHWAKNTIVITFAPCGGKCDVSELVIDSINKNISFPVPILDNYVFDGWYTHYSGGTKVTEGNLDELTSDTMLYAHWVGVEKKILFDANGGTVTISSKKSIYGENYSTLPIPEYNGYTFEGWFTKRVGGEIVTSGDTPYLLSNQTLYAHWLVNKPIMSINANSGYMEYDRKTVSIANKKTEYGKKCGELPVPFRDGYTFDGWYQSSNNELITPETIITSAYNFSIYAKWIPNKYLIQFDTNGGESVHNSLYVTYDKTYGELPNPVRKNYSFIGWMTKPVNGDMVNSNQIVKITDTQILYAQWKGVQKKLKFDANGGFAQIYLEKKGYGNYAEWETTIYYKENYMYLPDAFRHGYNFLGWYTSPDGGKLVTKESILEEASDQILYAHWEKKSFSLKFDANGGESDVTSKVIIYNNTYGYLPIPVRTGYTFIGWFTTREGKNEIQSTNIVDVTCDVTLYAQWRGNTHNIIFNGNGGNVSSSSITVTCGQSYGHLPIAVRDGYTMEGWYTKPNGGIKVDLYSIVNSDFDHTLYAHWKEEVYYVNYFANGGMLNTTYNYTTVEKGSSCSELIVPTREGFTFDGWYTKSIDGYKISTVTEQIDLYAHWTPKKYSIYFDAQGGSSCSSITTTYGDKYGVLPVPSKKNYSFDGWFTSKNGGKRISQTSDVNVTEDTVLYAHWNNNTYKLYYDANGGKEIEVNGIVTYDCLYGTLILPVRKGYNFIGWYTKPNGGTLVEEKDKFLLNSDQTIYAHWDLKKPTITFSGNGGTVYDNGMMKSYSQRSVLYGKQYGDLPLAIREGYEFAGWYCNSLKLENSMVMEFESDIYVYAKWKPISSTIIFHAVGGSCNVSSMEATYDSIYGGLPIPKKEGYEFSGWFTQEYGGTIITNNTVVNTVDTQHLYAHYTIKNYYLTIDGNGGKFASKEGKKIVYSSTWNFNAYYNGTYGNGYSTVKIPFMDGYDFIGYYTEKEGGVEVYPTENYNKKINKLYAHWKPKKTQIIFCLNGGNEIIKPYMLLKGEKYGTLPTPTRKYYSFDGWYTWQDKGDKITPDSTVNAYNSMYLYAHWKPKEVSVRLNPTGGQVEIKELLLLYHDFYGAIPSPVREDAQFTGWITKRGTAVTSSTVINDAITHSIYAQWKLSQYYVTFDGNGGRVEESKKVINYDRPYGRLPNAMREGYHFMGWYTEKDGGDLIQIYDLAKVKGNHTLYAHWE
ncbi:InlB B-repeat-containing protein [Anaerosporobacter faecicola]|uniref:InlB B-repeat-containing protein n=1 Tax=Anaerosporobacter faecicola TaxID=2718714 RepID=UPI001438E779|nr:InlB B-repeat-containing protein [Anaerosporobacter faecicola]